MRFQVLPVDSIASKAVHTLAKNQVFVWVGWASLVGLASFAILTSISHDIIVVIRVIDATVALAGACTVRNGVEG